MDCVLSLLHSSLFYLRQQLSIIPEILRQDSYTHVYSRIIRKNYDLLYFNNNNLLNYNNYDLQ